MDPVGAFLPIQKSDLRQGVYEAPCVTWPVRSDFDVLATHTFQIARWTVLGNPEEKTNQGPASRSCEATLKLYRFGVPRGCGGNSGVISHRRGAFLAGSGIVNFLPQVEASEPARVWIQVDTRCGAAHLPLPSAGAESETRHA
jgi:hypothetical protein